MDAMQSAHAYLLHRFRPELSAGGFDGISRSSLIIFSVATLLEHVSNLDIGNARFEVHTLSMIAHW